MVAIPIFIIGFVLLTPIIYFSGKEVGYQLLNGVVIDDEKRVERYGPKYHTNDKHTNYYLKIRDRKYIRFFAHTSHHLNPKIGDVVLVKYMVRVNYTNFFVPGEWKTGTDSTFDFEGIVSKGFIYSGEDKDFEVKDND